MTVETIPDGTVLAPHHFYVGVLLAWFGFMFVWRWYPRTGALLTLVGLLIAVDDAVQHAFMVKTPLHHLWWGVLFPIVQQLEAI